MTGADQSTPTPRADAARPVLHFTGHSDLLDSFAELGLDILRARCNGRVNHDAELRQVSVALAITTGAAP